ncbi:MAG: tetratricopeptide repeat protein [Bacteroidetes bacterium]|nr:tetratricopeptide repeat protein [Bacteroidota bacterium]
MRFSQKILLVLVVMMGPLVVASQTVSSLIRKGNKAYHEQNYSEAERNYRKSLELVPKDFKSTYNLAAAMYKAGQIEAADSIYKTLSGKTTDKDMLSKVYHNVGNSLMKQKKWEESINAYKQALKNSPSDLDTKYNLQYAKMMLEKQQQQQQQQDQQNQDKQNQDQQQQQQNQEKKDEKDEKQQQQPQQMTKKDAEKMLDALSRKEKQTQEKLEKTRQGSTVCN